MTDKNEPAAGADERPAFDATSSGGPPGFQLSLLWLFTTLLRRGWLLVVCGVAFSSLDLARRLLAKPHYTTTAVFKAQRRDASAFSAAIDLAQRLGLTRGGPVARAQELEQVLNSRPVLDLVGSRLYEVQTDDGLDSLHLADLLQIRSSTETRRRRRVRAWLRDAVFVRANLQLQSVSISVRSPWPRISQAVAEHLIYEVNRFNVETRQTTSRAEREFIEGQLDSALFNLTAAEQALQQFKDAHRRYSDWSPLSVQQASLEEDLAQRRRLYGNLRMMYDEAKVAEVRDTPVITMIQRPFLPVRPDGRGLALGTSSAFVAGVLAAMAAVVFLQYYAEAVSTATRRQLGMAWTSFSASIPIPILRRPDKR